MALRSLSIVLALTLVIASGCRRTANYQPACAPAVVATVPVAPPCPPGQIPPPPPGTVIVPR